MFSKSPSVWFLLEHEIPLGHSKEMFHFRRNTTLHSTRNVFSFPIQKSQRTKKLVVPSPLLVPHLLSEMDPFIISSDKNTSRSPSRVFSLHSQFTLWSHHTSHLTFNLRHSTDPSCSYLMFPLLWFRVEGGHQNWSELLWGASDSGVLLPHSRTRLTEPSLEAGSFPHLQTMRADGWPLSLMWDVMGNPTEIFHPLMCPSFLVLLPRATLCSKSERLFQASCIMLSFFPWLRHGIKLRLPNLLAFAEVMEVNFSIQTSFFWTEIGELCASQQFSS